MAGEIYGEELFRALGILEEQEVHQEEQVEQEDMLGNQVCINMSYRILYTNSRYYSHPDWSIWSKSYGLLCR